MSMMNEDTEQLLEKYGTEVATLPTTPDPITVTSNVGAVIDGINATITQREETQKLQLRERLTGTVTKFILIQLISFNVIVLIIILSVTVNIRFFKTIDNDTAALLFDFLKYYIGATVVELLGMLGFILHYVFSKHSEINKVQSN